MQTCDSVRVVYYVEFAFFVLAGVACWLFGTHRGVPLKRINFSESSYVIYLVAALSIVGAVNGLCVDSAVGTQDLPLTRPLIFVVLFSGCAVLVSRRLCEEAPFVTMHEHMAVLSQLPFGVSLLYAQHRSLFMGVSAVLAFAVLVHIWAESKAQYATNAKFSNATLWWLVVYVSVYYIAVLWGPWYQKAISLEAQEILLLCADTAVVLRICILLAHYGWSSKLSSHTLIPNELSLMSLAQQEQMITKLHTAT